MTDKKQSYKELEMKVRQLSLENTALQERAASELSGAWLLHRTMMGAQAALFCLSHGNQSEARAWLEGTTGEAQLEIPEGVFVHGLQRWFDENLVGHLTHAQAMTVVKGQYPITNAAANDLHTQGIVIAANYCRRIAKLQLSGKAKGFNAAAHELFKLSAKREVENHHG